MPALEKNMEEYTDEELLNNIRLKHDQAARTLKLAVKVAAFRLRAKPVGTDAGTIRTHLVDMNQTFEALHTLAMQICTAATELGVPQREGAPTL